MSDTGRRVLLTGINGFLGSHILAQLLEAGVSVRGVVRSQSKADGVRNDHPQAGDSLDFAIVEDITTPNAFEEALQSIPPFDAVIHTASPYLYRAVSDNRQFLDPAIKGTTEMLKGIKKVAPSVKKVVLTSSFAAVGAYGQYSDEGKTYTSADWNPTTLEAALVSKDLVIAYRASKKFAEKAGMLLLI